MIPDMKLNTIAWTSEPERPTSGRPRARGPSAARADGRTGRSRAPTSGEREQPGDLAAELGVEQPQQAGRAAEAAATAGRHRRLRRPTGPPWPKIRPRPS